MQRTLAWIAIAALTVLTALVLWAGIGMLMTMNESEKSQGGQFYVGVGLIVALAWLTSQFVSFAKRLRRDTPRNHPHRQNQLDEHRPNR